MADYSKLRSECLARFEGHDYIPTGPPVFAWHIHHGTLIELLFEPIANRVDYIIEDKPECEVETRLEWLRPLKGSLPAAYNKAGAACLVGVVEFGDGDTVCRWAAYNKAWAAYDKAGAELKPELEKLHTAELPGCPWDGDQLIFSAVVSE